MKKIKNTILFIVVGVFIFSGINHILRSEKMNTNWYQYKNVPNHSLDLFFAGNSRSFSTIQPNIIEDITGKTGYVLGVGSESLQITYYQLEKMFENQTPRFVFLEISPIHKYESGDKYSLYIDDFFGNFPFIEIDINVLWKLFQSDQILDIIPIAKYHTKLWKEPHYIFYNYFQYIKLNILINKPWIIDRYIKNRGYINGYKQISQQSIDELGPSNPVTKIKLSSDTQDMLDKIIKLCESNNAELILWSVPQYTDFVDSNGIKLDFQQIALNNDLEYLDLNEYPFEMIHFADINHVAPFGSQKVSVIISEYILSKYSLEENNYLQNYKSLTPQNYRYSINEQGNFEIKFYMEREITDNNIEAFLEYNEENLQGKQINDHNIQFTLPEKPQNSYVNIIFYNQTIDRIIQQDVFINYKDGILE